MKTSGGLSDLPDDTSEDVVKSEAEAIQIAEAAIVKREQERLELYRQIEAEKGREGLVDGYLECPLIYILERVEAHSKHCVLKYNLRADPCTLDGYTETYIAVNNKTGETRFNWFSEN